jgi:hypothetical protein
MLLLMARVKELLDTKKSARPTKAVKPALHTKSARLARTAKGQCVGYIRVSTLDQREDRQLEGVTVDRRFVDHVSGKDVKRPQLTALLSFVREGDTVVCHSMDRLGRNLDDLRKLVFGLTERGIRVEFRKENLIFTGEDSPMANLLLSVMGAIAEFERQLIRERQREFSCLVPGQPVSLPGSLLRNIGDPGQVRCLADRKHAVLLRLGHHLPDRCEPDLDGERVSSSIDARYSRSKA